jgi:hypothetical protein
MQPDAEELAMTDTQCRMAGTSPAMNYNAIRNEIRDEIHAASLRQLQKLLLSGIAG